MRIVLLALALIGLGLLASQESDFNIKPSIREVPVFNLPPPLREQNWGGGSCVHASWVMLLRWQGHQEYADWWRRSYAGGETWYSFTETVEANGLRWAGTYEQYDVAFLEWAIRTRRGCMVTCMGGRHMVVLCHLDQEWAGILDNNDIGTIHWVPRDKFLKEWRESYSWAMTPVYTPAPPLEVQ